MRFFPVHSSVIYKYLLFFLVLTVTFAVYSPSLSNQFVNWDDDVHLLENPFVRSLGWSGFVEIFTTTVNFTYIPLTTLSFAIERYFFGFNPFYFHLNNLILHVLVTALVGMLALRLGLSTGAAALAALIFGIHPVHVESVVWVTERKDVLFLFFYLLSVVVYLQYLRGRHAFWLVVSIGCGVLSVLAKSMALSLPLILLLCDWYVLKRISWRDIFNKFYYGVMILPLVWVTFYLNTGILKAHALTDALVWMWCFNFYLLKLVVPGHTAIFYDVPYPVAIQNGPYLVNGILFVLVWSFVWIRRRDRMLVFAFLFYLASIFFVLRFNVILDTVADRFMYLPSVGWCLWLGVVLERSIKIFLQKKIIFYVMISVLCGGIIYWIYTTDQRLLVWKDSQSLWRNQLRNSNAAIWLAQTKLADAYYQDAVNEGVFVRLSKGNSQALDDQDVQRLVVIEGLLNSAIQEKQDYSEPYYQLGVLYESWGNKSNAMFFYEQAYRFNPQHFMAAYKLGNFYSDEGRSREAVEFYERAVTINPYNEEVRRIILQKLASLMRTDDGAHIYREVYLKFLSDWN